MEIEAKIRALAAAAGIQLEVGPIVESSVNDDRCWVDGRVRCPYGKPEGQYIFRPTNFCGDSCSHYRQHLGDLELTDEQQSDVVNEHFDTHKTNVTGELRVRAKEFADGCTERLVLELAADLIEEKNLNRNILLEDDLPS